MTDLHADIAMHILLAYPFLIAVFWWVYIHITSQPEMIMNWLYVKLDNWTDKPNISKLNKLLSCEYCLAGFTSVFIFPLVIEYNFLLHLSFVSLSIFFVRIINLIVNGKETD